MLRSKKFAHGVQIGKARVIELRVLLLLPSNPSKIIFFILVRTLL